MTQKNMSEKHVRYQKLRWVRRVWWVEGKGYRKRIPMLESSKLTDITNASLREMERAINDKGLLIDSLNKSNEE